MVGQIEQARVIEPVGAAGRDRLGDIRPAHSREKVRGGAVGEHEVRDLARARYDRARYHWAGYHWAGYSCTPATTICLPPHTLRHLSP
jgi:hypothetical protein